MTKSQMVLKNLKGIVGAMSEDVLPKSKYEAAPGKPVIGVILDDFSMQCFRPEGTLWPISIRDMEMALDRLRPELMLIESAWSGNDGDWTYQITSATGPKPPFYRLIEACRERSIPTVFWNKEDPPHFQEFLPAASAADYIFTCEKSLVESYIKASGHSNVDVMRFAAQPRLHAPYRNQESRTGNVAFAGQYFAHKFPERREQMEMLFPAAAKLGFSIYSRVLGGDLNYAFPEKYAKFIVGSLPYSSMVKAYRNHKVFLNVNSVPESESMCARRIFELSASKTAVVSADTPAISSSYASDEIFTVNSASESASILETLIRDDEFREKATHRSWRRTLRDHTYENRLQEITLQIVGPVEKAIVPVVALCLISSVDSLVRLGDQIRRQEVRPSEIVIVPTRPEIRDSLLTTDNLWSGISSRITMLDSPAGLHHIDLLGKRVTIFSEAFDYGPNYLSDLILYSKHLDSPDIVGKGVSGDVRKNPEDYLGDKWPEDIETYQVLGGAWLSPGNCEWIDLILAEVNSPGSTTTLTRKIRVADRFNIRRRSNDNNVSWIA